MRSSSPSDPYRVEARPSDLYTEAGECSSTALILSVQLSSGTIGKLFQKILLSRILHEVNVRGLLRNEQFRFRARHRTSFQLARLVDRITRNFDEKRLTGAVFLDVAKAFDTVWIDDFFYRLTLLNIPSHIFQTISSYLGFGCSKRPSRRPRHLVEACGPEWFRVD